MSDIPTPSVKHFASAAPSSHHRDQIWESNLWSELFTRDIFITFHAIPLSLPSLVSVSISLLSPVTRGQLRRFGDTCWRWNWSVWTHVVKWKDVVIACITSCHTVQAKWERCACLRYIPQMSTLMLLICLLNAVQETSQLVIQRSYKSRLSKLRFSTNYSKDATVLEGPHYFLLLFFQTQ